MGKEGKSGGTILAKRTFCRKDEAGRNVAVKVAVSSTLAFTRKINGNVTKAIT